MVEVFFIPDNEQDVNYFKWKIETTITIKVQDKVSGKFLYLVHNKS